MRLRQHVPGLRQGVRQASLAILPALALSAVMPATGSAADQTKAAAYGWHLAQECTGCHRADGVDNGIPSIIGWGSDLFVTTMKYYQNGGRSNPVMVSVAKSLNDEQLQALASYYGSLPKPPPKAAAPADKKAKQ